MKLSGLQSFAMGSAQLRDNHGGGGRVRTLYFNGTDQSFFIMPHISALHLPGPGFVDPRPAHLAVFTGRDFPVFGLGFGGFGVQPLVGRLGVPQRLLVIGVGVQLEGGVWDGKCRNLVIL